MSPNSTKNGRDEKIWFLTYHPGDKAWSFFYLLAKRDADLMAMRPGDYLPERIVWSAKTHQFVGFVSAQSNSFLTIIASVTRGFIIERFGIQPNLLCEDIAHMTADFVKRQFRQETEAASA
jgi:hypothetical protein